MTNTETRTRRNEEVARTFKDNLNRILKAQGHDLTWLAGQIGIDVLTIVKHTESNIPMWLTFDVSEALDVTPDELLEAL